MTNDRKLLFSVTKKDLVVTWYKSGGGGGQKKNKTANACRIQHPDSGAMATGQEQRSREQNQKAAFNRLIETAKFKVWHARRCREEIDKQDGIKLVEETVKEQMAEQNLKVETKENGKWKEC